MTRRARVSVAIVVALSLLAAGPVARALFTTTATATVAVTVPEPVAPAPATMSCNSEVFSLLFVRARFNWTDPVAAVTPDEFVIRLEDATADPPEAIEIVRVAGTVHTYAVTEGLLSGLLGGLLGLLFGAGNPRVTVNAVFGTYESPSAWTHHLTPGGLLGLTGVGCAPEP